MASLLGVQGGIDPPWGVGFSAGETAVSDGRGFAQWRSYPGAFRERRCTQAEKVTCEKWRALEMEAVTQRGNVVRYLPEGHCLQITLPQYHADASYEIPLGRITTAREFCGWLDHLLEKSWIDEELIGIVVIAVDDAIGLRELG